LFINIYSIYPGVHIFLCASNINENSALSVVISLSLFPVHFFLHFYFATEMKTIECQTKRAIAIDTSTRTHIRNFRQSKILRNISGKSGGKASAHTRRILNQNIYPLENGCGCAHGFPWLCDYTLKIKWFFMFIAQILLLLFPLVVIEVFLLLLCTNKFEKDNAFSI